MARTIRRHGMLNPGDKVLIGVSGGPDSMALLHALIHLSQRLGIQLAMAHLNHGLRPKAADQDEAFVTAQASVLSLPFFVQKTDVSALHQGSGDSLEEAARKARYEFFQEILDQNNYTKLALGHHQDDNAELILMNLIRGSGILGLAGIPAVRGNQIVRPLMEISKKEILTFLCQRQIAFVTDTSNQDQYFLRNRIRHELMPLLVANYNPRMVATLNRLGRILQDEEAWAEEKIKTAMVALVMKNQDGSLGLSISDLQALHVAARKRLVRAIIKQLLGGLRRISADHLDAVLNLAGNLKKEGALNLPSSILVVRSGPKLSFYKTAEKRPRPANSPTGKHGVFESRLLFTDRFQPLWLRIESLDLEIRFAYAAFDAFNATGPADGRTVFFDLDQLDFPMILRNPRPGDQFQPLGMNGRQKIKKFFINHKVPRTERATCLVLESNGKIIWLVGYRIDDSVKVTHNTTRIVKAELLLAG